MKKTVVRQRISITWHAELHRNHQHPRIGATPSRNSVRQDACVVPLTSYVLPVGGERTTPGRPGARLSHPTRHPHSRSRSVTEPASSAGLDAASSSARRQGAILVTPRPAARHTFAAWQLGARAWSLDAHGLMHGTWEPDGGTGDPYPTCTFTVGKK